MLSIRYMVHCATYATCSSYVVSWMIKRVGKKPCVRVQNQGNFTAAHAVSLHYTKYPNARSHSAAAAQKIQRVKQCTAIWIIALDSSEAPGHVHSCRKSPTMQQRSLIYLPHFLQIVAFGTNRHTFGNVKATQ